MQQTVNITQQTRTNNNAANLEELLESQIKICTQIHNKTTFLNFTNRIVALIVCIVICSKVKCMLYNLKKSMSMPEGKMKRESFR